MGERTQFEAVSSSVSLPVSFKQAAALKALKNEAPMDALIDYLRSVESHLRDMPSARGDPLLAELAIVVEAIAEALDPLARTTHFLGLSQRKRGRPKSDHALGGLEVLAVTIIERRPKGEKVEAAVQRAMDLTQLGRSKIFAARRQWRRGQMELEAALSVPTQSGKLRNKANQLLADTAVWLSIQHDAPRPMERQKWKMKPSSPKPQRQS